MLRLQDSPPLTRFAVEKKKMTSDRVKAKLFEPNQGQVSVFRTQEWSREQIEDCGKNVARQRDKDKVYGWAILATGEVPKVPDVGPLYVEDDDAPPGHSNIVGWPEEKDDILNWQEVLAKHSEAVLLQQPLEV